MKNALNIWFKIHGNPVNIFFYSKFQSIDTRVVPVSSMFHRLFASDKLTQWAFVCLRKRE